GALELLLAPIEDAPRLAQLLLDLSELRRALAHQPRQLLGVAALLGLGALEPAQAALEVRPLGVEPLERAALRLELLAQRGQLGRALGDEPAAIEDVVVRGRDLDA